MVFPGTGFFGDPYLAFNAMHYPYNLGLRTDSYATNLYEKSKAVMNMTAINDDRSHGESGAARKRIAMACGRCRKRKIRCSGDKGDGQPCTNCSNANHSPCQFLRVNSCETHYRNDFNYNLELSRGTQARTTVVPLPSQVDEENSANFVQGHLNFRIDPQHCENRIWHPQGAPEASNVDYTLSSNPTQDTYVVSYRSPQNQQSRTQEPTVYLSNAGLIESTGYQYNGGGHVSTLAFRPAPVVNIGGPSGPGTFPILNAMPGDVGQMSSTSRNMQSTGAAPERHPLPSSSTYRATSVSPGYERTSRLSPRSRHSPASMLESSNAYGHLSSSPASTSTEPTIPNIGEIKLDPEGTPEAVSHGDDRQQVLPELHYRYADTTQYRHPSSPSVSGIIHIAPTLPSQAAVDIVRSTISPSCPGKSVRSPSGSRH